MNTTPCSFTTTLPVQVLCRPGRADREPDELPVEWREHDRGPGSIELPEGEEATLRIKNLDDDLLRQLVSELTGCEAIRGLNLSENRNVSDAGLAYLVHLPWLRYLSLSSCGITDHGFVHLLALPGLQVLDLSYCNRITNDGVLRLRSLRHLAYLDLQGCVHINNRSLARLRKEGLTIHHRTVV